jgi:hypothetical protein
MAAKKKVRPKGFEPLTLGSEGYRPICLKLCLCKELRQRQRGVVIPVVLHELPPIGTSWHLLPH